ncbi:MAG: hypothetical protein NWF14_04380 [Candidatus Bathyarchaeota archaeon]|nr:hypothetical protein [Candidatus Bathyarchaeota archaeon]
MTFTWDPIYTLNLMLCIAIFVLGYFGNKKKGNDTSLYIGIAFGLFGVSHFATLLGLKATLTSALIVIRTFAYLIVIFSLYKALKK